MQQEPVLLGLGLLTSIWSGSQAPARYILSPARYILSPSSTCPKYFLTQSPGTVIRAITNHNHTPLGRLPQALGQGGTHDAGVARALSYLDSFKLGH